MEMLSGSSLVYLVFLTAFKCIIGEKLESRAMRIDGNTYMNCLEYSFSRFKFDKFSFFGISRLVK